MSKLSGLCDRRQKKFELLLAEKKCLNFTEHDWLDNKVPVLNAMAIMRDIPACFIPYSVGDKLPPPPILFRLLLFSVCKEEKKKKNGLCFLQLKRSTDVFHKNTVNNIPDLKNG